MVHDESVIFSDAVAEQFKAADKTLMALESYILANKNVLHNPHVDYALNQMATLYQVQYGVKPSASLSVESFTHSVAMEGVQKALWSVEYGIRSHFVHFFWLFEAMRSDAQKALNEAWRLQNDLKKLKDNLGKSKNQKSVSFSGAKYLVEEGEGHTSADEAISQLDKYARKLSDGTMKKNVTNLIDGIKDTTEVIRGIWFFSNRKELEKIRAIEKEAKDITLGIADEHSSSSTAVMHLGANGIKYVNFVFNEEKDMQSSVYDNSKAKYNGDLAGLSDQQIAKLIGVLEKLLDNTQLESNLIELADKVKTMYGYNFMNGKFLRMGALFNSIIGVLAGGTVAGPAGGAIGGLAGFAINAGDIRRSMAVGNTVSHFRMAYIAQANVKNETAAAAIKWIKEST